MVSHLNDHTPAGASVEISQREMTRIEDFMTDMFSPLRQVAESMLAKESAAPAPAVLSAEQFGELKALLQPGFELSTLMLADYKARQEATAGATAYADRTASGDAANKPNADDGGAQD